MQKTFVPCNLCGSTDSDVLYPSTLDPEEKISAGHFSCTSSFYGAHGPIVKCDNCGLIYLNPRISGVIERYEQVVDETYAEEEEGRILTFARSMEEIERHVKGGRLLDVGSYTGVFLQTARERGREGERENEKLSLRGGTLIPGIEKALVPTKQSQSEIAAASTRPRDDNKLAYNYKLPITYYGSPTPNPQPPTPPSWHVYGVEPSRWASEYCKSKFGIELSGKTIGDASFPDGFFDLVTMHDSLDHMEDPKSALLEANRVLRKGGYIYITATDISCRFARLLGTRWPWLMEMHLYYFTPETLSKMLNEAGFEVLNVYPHRRILTVRYLVGKIGNRALNALVRGATKVLRLYDKPLTVNFGDIMTLIARKQ